MSENKVEKKYVKMIKTCVGNLRITFINPATQSSQEVVFQSSQQEKLLPIDLAALVYTDTGSGAYRAFKNGYFTFDDVAAVRQNAEDRGIMMGELDFTPEPANYSEVILEDLKSGKKSQIESHFDTAKHQEDVVRVAREHIGDLTKGTIDLIQKTLKVTLEVDGE